MYMMEWSGQSFQRQQMSGEVSSNGNNGFVAAYGSHSCKAKYWRRYFAWGGHEFFIARMSIDHF